MDCKKSIEFMYRDLDGRLPESELSRLDSHLKTCAKCCDAKKAVQSLLLQLKFEPQKIMPSENFDSGFYQKILLSENTSWLQRALDYLSPSLSIRPILAGAMIAVLLGTAGGVASANVLSPSFMAKQGESSGFGLSGGAEYRGIPANSLAGGYLQRF